MNQFYDKKTKDETLDEFMNRQIQEQRTDKYEIISKNNEDCRKKIEQYRDKIERMAQNHEKQLNFLNLHLDDIKKQNIELRKSVH